MKPKFFYVTAKSKQILDILCKLFRVV